MGIGQTVLIVGCGYVGMALGRYLSGEGFRVFGLRRDTSRLPKEIEPLTVDLMDKGSLLRVPGSWDYVVYLTGASGRNVTAYREAYVLGLRNLIEVLERRSDGTPRLIFASSTGVYGETDGSWVNEDTQLDSVSGPTQCLVEGEAIVSQVPWGSIVVRFGGIYGPGRCSLLRRIRLGEMVQSNASAYTNRIHREDCVGVLHHLMGLETPAPLYLAVDNEPVELSRLVDWLAHEMEVSLPLVSETIQPSRPGRNKRCRNTRLRESGYAFRYPSFREGYGALLRDETHARR